MESIISFFFLYTCHCSHLPRCSVFLWPPVHQVVQQFAAAQFALTVWLHALLLSALFPLCDRLSGRVWSPQFTVFNIEEILSQNCEGLTPFCSGFCWCCWRRPVSFYINSKGFRNLFFLHLYPESIQWALVDLFSFVRLDLTFLVQRKFWVVCLILFLCLFCVFLEYLLIKCWTSWVKVVFLIEHLCNLTAWAFSLLFFNYIWLYFNF